MLAMTLTALKGKYARLRDEIDLLESVGKHSEAKLARLKCELDQIDHDLAVYRRLAEAAPTLRDVVAWAEPARPAHVAREDYASVR
jgi:hypothetical protein